MISPLHLRSKWELDQKICWGELENTYIKRREWENVPGKTFYSFCGVNTTHKDVDPIDDDDDDDMNEVVDDDDNK